jgi:hypothetical protein
VCAADRAGGTGVSQHLGDGNYYGFSWDNI